MLYAKMQVNNIDSLLYQMSRDQILQSGMEKCNSDVTNSHISWLEDRIEKTQEEKVNADEESLKISKGGKLRGYMDVLNYIREHS